MAGQYSADCKAKPISGMEKLHRRLKLFSLSYQDDLPTRMANVDKPSWVSLIFNFSSTDISHPVGEPGRQKSCEFACIRVLARGFATGDTAIPMY